MTLRELEHWFEAFAAQYPHEKRGALEYVFEVPPDPDDPDERCIVVVSYRKHDGLLVGTVAVRPWEPDGSLAIPLLRANFNCLNTRVGLHGDLVHVVYSRLLGHLGAEELSEAVFELAGIATMLAAEDFATSESTEQVSVDEEKHSKLN